MKSKSDITLQWLDEVQDEGTLIVVFANSKYLIVLNEWLSAIRDLAISNFLVIAMDHSLKKEMTERDIPVLYRPCAPDFETICIHRVYVLHEILNAGFNIVHSDADAFWRKNPLHEYIYAKEYDMVFSPGTYWPMDVYREWGFVLCFGFFYIASSVNTRALFKEYVQAVRTERSDQASLNRLLFKRGMTWQENASYELMWKGQPIKYFTKPTEGKAGDLHVCILPNAQFQRMPEQSENLYIQHWLSEKTPDSKLAVINRSSNSYPL